MNEPTQDQIEKLADEIEAIATNAKHELPSFAVAQWHHSKLTPLQSRITELEAQIVRKDEALRLASECFWKYLGNPHDTETPYGLCCIAVDEALAQGGGK